MAQWLWWPYRRLVRHRGWLSHTPLLGSASRLLLLLGWLLLALTWTASHRRARAELGPATAPAAMAKPSTPVDHGPTGD